MVMNALPASRPVVPDAAPPDAEARRIAKCIGVSLTVAEWLRRRGFDGSEATQRFLEPRLAHLSSPDAMTDRAAAADRIARAIRQRERVCVFGDYDCDGITSATIVTEVIRALGGDAEPLLASRFDGGYGVSAAAARRIEQSGASLLVTCDCGSSDHEVLRGLAAKGLEIVVIDHHLVPDEPLPAVAFLNPHRPECGFGYKGLASCGLALSLAAALRAVLGKQLDVRRWLDLVAIGTIADVAPLDGDNRALVRAGLALMRTAPRPGVRALLELARLDGVSPLTGEDIAYRIAPRINAPGRLGPPDLAMELLLSRTDETARALAAEIEQISARRKEEQERISAEAIDDIEQGGLAERAAIVVGRPGWGHGIVGIVAGRLVSRYGKPVVVVAFDGEVGRGSVRGPAGVRLHDAISGLSDCLERFGGHQAAAGLEVRASRLAELGERFAAAFEDAPRFSTVSPAADAVPLAPEDAPARVVADLDRLEPCGEGNPAPRIRMRAEVIAARRVKGGHLKVQLRLPSGHEIGGFAFDRGDAAAGLSGSIELVGALRRDTWRGGDAVEVRIEEIL
jgi:single-stranded-DNA-specific exonuclease